MIREKLPVLSKKAERVYKYLIDNIEGDVTIGAICRNCNTTVITLLNKIRPELFEKGYFYQKDNFYVLSEERAIEYLTESMTITDI